MKYLAMVLMPAKKDLQFFKLKDFLELSCQQISALKNKENNVLYQMIAAEKLDEAQDAVRLLNPPVHMDNTPEEQKRLMNTPLTHAIFELADDFDPARPLKEFVALVYLLKPEAYPHAVISQELDEVDARVRILLKEIEDTVDDGVVKQHQKSLNEALHQQEQLNALLQEMQLQPARFEGPQFHRVYPDYPVQASVSVAHASCECPHDAAGNNNNETAEEYQRRMAQPRPSVNGFYAHMIARNPAAMHDAGCEEKSSAASQYHR